MSNYPNDLLSQNNEIEQAKLYAKPAIIHELKLETRAGTPLGPAIPDPLDPLGVDPSVNPR